MWKRKRNEKKKFFSKFQSQATDIKNNSASLSKTLDKNDLFSNDDIEKNGLKIYAVDKIKVGKKAFIVNTDISSGPGIHYITLYPMGNIVYIVDSLGKNNYRPYDYIMFKKLQNYDVEFYPASFQFSNTSLCGWLATAAALILNHHKPKTPQEVDEVLDSYFGKDRIPTNADEKVLLRFFKLE